MDVRHVVVVGPMAVGKSTLASALAGRYGRPLRDSDAELAAERGITGRELAESEGVAALHRWEVEHLHRSLADATPAVVAAAASVLDDGGCREALAPSLVVALTAPAAVLDARMAADRNAAAGAAAAAGRRRSLGPDEFSAIAALDRRRAAALHDLADVVIDTEGRAPAEVAAAAEEGLAALPGGGPARPRPSHVGICVTDLDRSLRFYRDGLGFTPTHAYKVGPEMDRLMGLDGVELRSQFLRRDGVTIELLAFAAPVAGGGDAPRPLNRAGLTHLCVRVPDVDAAAARLAQVGGTVLTATRTTLGDGDARSDFVYCTDPDGTRVELMRLPAPA